MGFTNIIQSTASGVPGNQGVMEYLRKIVPRMFQNTLSLLSRQIIQQFLDELVNQVLIMYFCILPNFCSAGVEGMVWTNGGPSVQQSSDSFTGTNSNVFAWHFNHTFKQSGC